MRRERKKMFTRNMNLLYLSVSRIDKETCAVKSDEIISFDVSRKPSDILESMPRDVLSIDGIRLVNADISVPMEELMSVADVKIVSADSVEGCPDNVPIDEFCNIKRNRKNKENK